MHITNSIKNENIVTTCMPAASVNGSFNNYVQYDDVNGNCGLLNASQKMTHPYLFLLFSMTSFNSHYQGVTTL